MVPSLLVSDSPRPSSLRATAPRFINQLVASEFASVGKVCLQQAL